MKYQGKVFIKQELSGQEYSHDTFDGCNFANHLIRFTTFENCHFTNCDFSSVRFENSNFQHCSFPGSKLSYANFASVRLVDCQLDHAIINNAIFQDFVPGSTVKRARYDLSTCSFTETSLDNTVFAKCNLVEVDFSSSSLVGSSFESCDLADANFVGTTITNTSLDSSKLKGLKLSINGFLQYGVSKGFLLESKS